MSQLIGQGLLSKPLRESRGARRSARLARFHHELRAFLRRLSPPGARSSPWKVRLQETEDARRKTPPRSHARFSLRILAAALTSGATGSKLGTPGPLPLTRETLSFPQGGIRFSETGAPGRTCGRPRPQEAPPRARPLRAFSAGPTPGHLAQHRGLACCFGVLARVH